MHLDYAPDVTGGAMFPLLECFGGRAIGDEPRRGGMGNLPRALRGMLERRGGSVLTGAEVDRIVLQDGAARDLTTVDGRRIRTRRGIVSTAVLPRTASLLEDGDHGLGTSAAQYRFGPGTFMLHLTTDRPIPWTDAELGRFAYVHQGGYVDDMARTYQQTYAGLLPDRPLIVIGQTSVVDPHRTAAPDRHVVWLQVRTVPARIRGDGAGLIPHQDWADASVPFGDRIIDLVEANAPGFRASILAGTR